MTVAPGEDLALKLKSGGAHYHRAHVCPGCEADLMTTAVVHLAYTFRECDCGVVNYTHLAEQLWHLACLQGRKPELDKAATLALSVLTEQKTTAGRRADEARHALTQALLERSA